MPETLTGACHCGAVTFRVSRPEFAVRCNCSICRRYAAVWAHCPPNEGQIMTGSDHLTSYSRGDHLIRFHACQTCGCVTHWGPGDQADQDRFAVNLNMVDPERLTGLRVRQFDGAQSWTFLD